MKKKLLNFSKNLIIVLGLVAIVDFLFFATSSYADTQHAENTLGQLMRHTISEWYWWIRNICLSVYSIGFLLIIIKLLFDGTPEKLAKVKNSILYFILIFFTIFFLHGIMIIILKLNQEGINIALSVGKSFSGIDMSTDEYDLYETALSKAYEISALPGFIGLVLYLLLVFFTFKFAIIYAKRFFNIIFLTLYAPIIFVISSTKKILTGISDGKIVKWFKEYIFNVVIQTFHAIMYAFGIGLTLKISDDYENLIGVILTLIIFAFIPKIDGFIREQIFNRFGGSTSIKSSKTAGAIIDTAGGAVTAGLGAIGAGANAIGSGVSSGIEGFGKNIEEKGLGQAVKEGAANVLPNAKIRMKQLSGQAFNTVKGKALEVGSNALESAKTGVKNVKKSAANALAEAKADIKDAKNILNGERVKANLTEDEIVAAQHQIDNPQGLEKLRQSLQGVSKSSSNAKKYLSRKAKKAASFVSGRLKLGIEAEKDYYRKKIQFLQLENEVELIKKLPKIIKNQKMIKVSKKNKELNPTNAMMLCVDKNFDSQKFFEEIKNEYKKGNPIIFPAFKELTTAAALSPVVGSTRIGLGLLSEAKTEEALAHKTEALATGKKREKVTIIGFLHKDKNLNLVSTIDAKIEKYDVNQYGDTTNIKKREYTFNRFNSTSVRTITNRIKKDYVLHDRYLNSLTRTKMAITTHNIKVRGRASNRTVDIERTIRASRKDRVKSIRQIVLEGQAAVVQYRNFETQANKIQTAHIIANQVCDATNKIRLGFNLIDNMTPGQIGLQKMIQDRSATELSGGLIAMRQTGSIEDKLRATGIVQQQNGEMPHQVVQFVLTEEGKIVPQIVTLEGKIVMPANDLQLQESIKPLILQIMEQQATGMPIEIEKQEGETKEQFELRQVVTTAFVEYLQVMSEEAKANDQVQEAENQEKLEQKQTITESFIEYLQLRPEEMKKINQVIATADSEPEEQEDKSSEESMKNLDTVVQHIVTPDGSIVKQVVNSNNEIEVEGYQIVEKADDSIMIQIQDLVKEDNVISNEDLGLSENATTEEKMASFQNLMNDIQRTNNTQDLLQDIMASPVEDEKTEEIPPEVFVEVMEENHIHSKEEFRQIMFMMPDDNGDVLPAETPKEEFARKQEVVNDIVKRMPNISSEPTGPQYGSEDYDNMEDAMEHLNEQVEKLTEPDNNELFSAAAEMERINIIQNMIENGEIKSGVPPTDEVIDSKISNLSELLINLAAEKATEDTSNGILNYSKEVLGQTVDAMKDVIRNAEQGKKSEAEIAFEKEVMKAEKKWAKKHGTKADSEIVDRINGKSSNKKDSAEDQTVKITLKFYGGVKTQGQSVTLSNHHSIKDFYDKVDKLDSADMNKTVERFRQTYGDKLKQMLLTPFNFSKNPVQDMDGWSIYVVTKYEDVTEGEKQIEREKSPESSKEPISPEEKTIAELVNKYFHELKGMFIEFIKQFKISSFDDIFSPKKKSSETNEKEFRRKIRDVLIEPKEKIRAGEIAKYLQKDKRFRNILEAVKDAEKEVKDAKARVKITTEKDAQKSAATRITKDEVDEFKNKEKDALLDELLDSVMTSQEEAARVSSDVNDVLKALNENDVFVTTTHKKDNKQNRLRLEYQTE